MTTIEQYERLLFLVRNNKGINDPYFVPYDAHQKKGLARRVKYFNVNTGRIKINNDAWFAISMWNAMEIFKSDSTDFNYISRMMKNDMYDVRVNNRNTWIKKIIDSFLKKTGINYFIEPQLDIKTNFPKIKESDYNNGITIFKLTEIILNHRIEVKKWLQAQFEQKNANAAKEKAQIEETPETEPETKDIEIILEMVDDWEELDF